MKSLFKVTLLATTLAMAFSAPQALAAKADSQSSTELNSAFKTEDQQNAYALGASLGRYMQNTLKEQKSLGIPLDKDQLLSGVQDAFNNKSKLTDSEIENTLRAFEGKVKSAAEAKMEKEARENEAKGAKYREEFAKEKGVVKSKTGLLYKIEKDGSGKKPVASDTIVVNYRGALIDGKEFDSSYKRNEPLSIRLDSVIPGWTEGLQNVKKGGKIKLVIPPELAYGKADLPGIPANSTLVFDIELLDVKADTKAK